MSKHLIIIDCYAIFFKSLFANPLYQNANGTYVGGVTGFINTMFRLLDHSSTLLAMHKNSETYVCIALDYQTKGETFRHHIYQEYKANRKPLPQEFILQFPILEEVLECMKIPVIKYPKVEADDIIASVVKKFYNQDNSSQINISIVSQDKDLMQLIAVQDNRNTVMWDPYKRQVIDECEVITKLGIKPHQVPCFLALLGDSADNIRGVPGIGKKHATTLLSKFESVDEICQNTHMLSNSKIALQITDNIEQIALFKTLTTLVDNIEITIPYEEMKWNGWASRSHEMNELFSKYQMQSAVNNKKNYFN
ncbi:5'-3' exonuclease [Candidatus Fokinia crypta]|uniref:DNA polymerase I-like-3' exonuclease domain protein n=1 Tax=Candidatus Fokinia crypta TaxID=1920990 RepID=A0ABZ0UR41_9RICK|nr:5'-3' exonuclease H3TH domain-containing protein [Candidatus Fokinia cryptica]WPX98137.1 DNA polymerase I-like-3' exonuclease domain protein [Candidatus Fokinia cryptica]